MKWRIAQEPWGPARFAYSYLGVVVMTLAAALLTVVINPITQAMNVCSPDAAYCQMGVTAIIAAVCFIAVGFPVAYVLRLGWLWAAWLPTFALIVMQICTETSVLSILFALAFVPLLAAAMTYERPNREIHKGWRIARVALLVVAIGQFIVWLVLLAGMPGQSQ